MKCIYCKKTEIDGATFKSQEHIFSAGLGGKTMLQKGFVCDICNTKIFSPLELKFMKSSLISLLRQFLGPGKRGSIQVNNASESEVHLLRISEDSSDYGLGYMKLGQPEFIDQFIFENNEIKKIILSRDQENKTETALEILKEKIKNFNNKFYFVQLLQDEYKGETLVSYYNDKYYIADKTREKAEENIQKLKEKLITDGSKLKKVDEEIQKSQVTSHQKIILNLDIDSKVIVKMGFNLFAHLKGTNYILDSKFDSTREFIISQSNEQRNPIITSNNFDEKFKSLFPKGSHLILLTNYENKTVVTVIFYEFQICYALELFPFLENIDHMGLVIDWRNEKDYLLTDYLKTLIN